MTPVTHTLVPSSSCVFQDSRVQYKRQDTHVSQDNDYLVIHEYCFSALLRNLELVLRVRLSPI